MSAYLPVISALGFAFTNFSKSLRYELLKNMSPNLPIYEPPRFTSIIVPTLNEEKYIETCLKSLRDQTVLKACPDKFEIIVADSHSYDDTVAVAKKYADKVLMVPKGKLNSRHLATLEAKGDVIYSADADTFFPSSCLSFTLRHFQKPDVVGVWAPRLYGDDFLDMFMVYHHLIIKKMPGSNCAYKKEAYFKIGGFNLGIDQLDRKTIYKEEEINFYKKLSKIGRVVCEPKGVVITSARHIKRSDPEYELQRLRKIRFLG